MKKFLCILLLTGSIYAADGITHIQGKLLKNGIDIEHAMKLAHAAGSKIAWELSDSELVETYRERIFALLEAYTDTLIIYEKEAQILTQLPNDRAHPYLKNFCPNVIILPNTSTQKT